MAPERILLDMTRAKELRRWLAAARADADGRDYRGAEEKCRRALAILDRALGETIEKRAPQDEPEYLEEKNG